MTFTNERRIVSNITASLYNAEREVQEALNHGTQFTNDFAEVFLTLAKVRGQLAVMHCKFNALESVK